MNTMMDRFRTNRAANRRSRALDRALRTAPSQAVRDELLAIASRYEW